MFFHELHYFIRSQLRNRTIIIWIILFPILLGSFFKMAFGTIYDSITQTRAVPVAVVEEVANPAFHAVIRTMEAEAEPFLQVTWTDEDHALHLLENGEVSGILYLRDTLSLTVAAEGMEESLLAEFSEQFRVREAIITDALLQDPQNAPAVIAALSENQTLIETHSVTSGNTDPFTQYFYNLIAMTALYGFFLGLQICTANQANLSALGARKSCSPIPRPVSLAAALLGSWLIQSLCMILCVTFLAFVLKIDLGSRIPLVYLSAILGGVTGVSIGFFAGAIGNMNLQMKTSLCTGVIMLLCFLSGLMVGDMKVVIAQKLPWFNRINPAAVISDSFYCLNLYSDYAKFAEKLATMLATALLFSILGILVTRRKSYASL